MGWPEETDLLKAFYPTSVLVTSRDIITLWVARMVLMGRYLLDEIPFPEVYIHPKILDGFGETMSKSKGNGVDPLDVIEQFGADALRFGIAYLTTETQDVRMPVEFVCPQCNAAVKQTKKNRVLPRIDCPKCERGVPHAVGREARGPRPAPRPGHQRAVRARPELLQQAVERQPVRADQPGWAIRPAASAGGSSTGEGDSQLANVGPEDRGPLAPEPVGHGHRRRSPTPWTSTASPTRPARCTTSRGTSSAASTWR